VAVVFFSLLFLAVNRCPAGSPADLLVSLRQTYETTEDLTARFLQVSQLVASGMETRMAGEVKFRKGGKMRWEYEGDDPQVLVSDGSTLWIHQVRDRTVLRQDLDALPASSRLALDLLSGFEGVEKAFALADCGEACLELKPLEARPDLSRVLVQLQADQSSVASVTTEDPLGNRTEVEFTDVRRNVGIPDSAFRFEVPEGVQVMEMEAVQP
jgi:outer membrane lipoprotein carrier protein